MTDAVSRTKSLDRQFLAVEMLEPNPLNPNQMSVEAFNMLVDNIERTGITDPILVLPQENGRYLIVGGEHRWQAAKMLGFDEVPVTIITDPNFTMDDVSFQTVRHNIIHGKMSPERFVKLYESLSDAYSEETASMMFGFTDEEEFQKLLKSTRKNLPKELRKEFDEAKDEIKTIEDLATVINRLFAKHGDTLPFGYMIIESASKGSSESFWLRMRNKFKHNALTIGSRCRSNGVTMDSVMAHIFMVLAEGGAEELFEEALENGTKVDMSILGDVDMPLEDYLDVV